MLPGAYLEGGLNQLHMPQDVLGAEASPGGKRISQGCPLHVDRVQPARLIRPPVLLEFVQRLHIHLRAKHGRVRDRLIRLAGWRLLSLSRRRMPVSACDQ